VRSLLEAVKNTGKKYYCREGSSVTTEIDKSANFCKDNNCLEELSLKGLRPIAGSSPEPSRIRAITVEALITLT